ncbi:glycosyltransferase family 2 protein [Vibrio harveyi]|uniref:glycosyltransferase family 2 protein n=1 Tax=Vibrio harveyi TaxID=669 RepID=UPI002B3A5103|nr:glycosyltransferase family 2 protein [Vibrio harveyi]HEQ3594964.1 glycosyltransferase family 2 protein [Vibrio harveyi]HEQ3606885.1 glycosyltransferase family 2 protein [Vibrio harveyi]
MEKDKIKQNVTVAVITYNSERTVIDTLDSIAAQDYGSDYIELVISDDASKDKTIDVVNQWVNENKEKFFSVKVIENRVNGGLPKNCNIAWKNSTSSWIKSIAGDDLLLPSCISDNVDYVSGHEDCSIVFSFMQDFSVEDGDVKKGTFHPKKYQLNFFRESCEKQRDFLLRDSFNFSPTSFIKRELIVKVGFAEEKFKLIEDLPLWIKILESGEKLYFMERNTVLYRYSESISRSKTEYANVEFLKVLLELQHEFIKPRLTSFYDYIAHFDRIFLLNSDLFIAKVSSNKKNKFSSSMKLLFSLLRPLTYARKLKKNTYSQ